VSSDALKERRRFLCSRASLIWNLDFSIGLGLCSAYRSYGPINVPLHRGPVRIAQHHNCKDSLRKIPSITNFLVGRQKYFKSRFFRRSQQFAVAERIPAKILGLLYCLVLKNERRGAGVPWSKRMII
jgi:hypothetical protein